MKEDVFWEGWNRVKNDRGPNPVRLGEDHQGLSNLVEVKVQVLKFSACLQSCEIDNALGSCEQRRELP